MMHPVYMHWTRHMPNKSMGPAAYRSKRML